MAVILFVDMLGSRQRWHAGGVEEATRAFHGFKMFVNTAARRAPPGEILDGVIETDAAMLVCRSAVEALQIARRLYLAAFAYGRMNPETPRFWYRGCVVPHGEEDFLREASKLRSPVQSVSAFRYSASALQAVSVEKSGFKGMRILVDGTLVSKDVEENLKISFDTHTLIPFRQLSYSHYPQRVAGQYTDFLWMASASEDDWHDLSLRMTSRLRYAARDAEELAQAAATQIVFHEYAALRKSVIGRARRSASRQGNAGAATKPDGVLAAELPSHANGGETPRRRQ